MGGSVLAVDMHAWAATMLAFVCRPPDPRYVGDAWRDMQLRRLDEVEPFLHTWLDHQKRDDHCRHGSVCEDYGAIRAAVLAVGGWHDPYRDTVLRLVEHLPPDRVRGQIGPWSHQYPDRGLPPGPAIGFLQETLRRPRARLRLTSQVPRGQVITRVCDVAPDGSSTLVTRV